ncbi:hypothetical protein GBP346_A3837 [Burkholderia pseudomallei MSHR346]|nr:hypothetical protein GBP346_A3837 [Burkholderia pseudomallei MSHR346]
MTRGGKQKGDPPDCLFRFEPPFPPTVAAAVTVGSRNATLP